MASKKPAKSPRKAPAKKPAKAKSPGLSKEEIEALQNSREYPELVSLLATAPYKTLATVEWLNERLPTGQPKLEKATKKDRERFVISVIQIGTAATVIQELRDTPTRQWKDFFSKLAGGSPARATAALSELKPKDFAALCDANGITPVRSGAKGSISKPKTIPLVIARLKELAEYLKL